MVTVRRRELAGAAAGLSWPAATDWLNRAARRPRPGWLGWRACGSARPGELARRANVRRSRRMLFTVASWWAGPGGGGLSRLIPLLAAAAVFTTRNGPRDGPHNRAWGACKPPRRPPDLAGPAGLAGWLG
jgi:hypothetical protein